MNSLTNKFEPELRKARLPTGETIWVKREGDFARIVNIPVSTNEYTYGDLVLLTLSPDGMVEISERLEWGGYTTTMLKASNDDGTVKEFFTVLEQFAVTERVDEDHVIVAAKPEDWEDLLKQARERSSCYENSEQLEESDFDSAEDAS